MPEIWSKALHRLSEKVAQQNFEMWLRPIECASVEGRVLHLRAPNPYVRLWFENNYLAALLDEIRQATGDDYSVEFLAPRAVEAQEGGPSTPPPAREVAPPPPVTRAAPVSVSMGSAPPPPA